MLNVLGKLLEWVKSSSMTSIVAIGPGIPCRLPLAKGFRGVNGFDLTALIAVGKASNCGQAQYQDSKASGVH
jgi:hypothetical protein